MALCALERNGACWGLPLLCSAELALVIAPQKTGIDAGPGLASSLVLVPMRGTWRTFCASGGLPGPSLFLLWGGWLPRPLRTCSLGLAGCPGRALGLRYSSLREAVYWSRRPRNHSTQLRGSSLHRVEGAGGQGTAKGCGNPSDMRKSTDLPGPGWPSEPEPSFSTRTRS